tara:strand:+ start:1236 stop:1595 length:360 start_codon:yes stop_codon:yes gene_type:complete
MTTSEKAVEVLKTIYGVDARIYEDNVFISHWNSELSDTIDIEISKDQVKDLAEEMKPKSKIGTLEYWKKKCELTESLAEYLDALANYERDKDEDDKKTSDVALLTYNEKHKAFDRWLVS